jgi:hypothetical protein
LCAFYNDYSELLSTAGEKATSGRAWLLVYQTIMPPRMVS